MTYTPFTAPHGTRREWLMDETDLAPIAVIIGTGQMERAVIDEWADLVIETILTWPPERRPISLLLDLTSDTQGFTPYARKRAEEVYDAVPAGGIVYGAIVIRAGIINSIISLFVRRHQSKAGEIYERVFTALDDALAWLRAQQQNPRAL